MPVTLVCPNCRFRLDVTPSEAKFGMLCPDCHQRRMRPPRGRNPGGPSGRTVLFRPAAVRLLVGGAVLGFVGAALLLGSSDVLRGRGAQGMVGARFFAYGVVFSVSAVVCVLSGAGIIARDLLQDDE